MKSLLSIIVVVFALSLCNLTGKRSNENNSNRPPSGTTEETNQNANSQATQPPPAADTNRIGSGVPPAPRNQNSAMPRIEDAPPVRTLPSPPSVPRAPISGGVLNGKATYLPKPAYPPIAKAAKASGTVRVQVVVDENGNVISASPVSGHPLLQSSAVQAARQAKFSPTKLSGQPVKISGVIIYNFVAQ